MEPKHQPQAGALAKFWDKYSPVYAVHTEPYTAPVSLQLALQTHFINAKTVLETGCGSGLASTLIRNILQPGATYCCLDISMGMLDLFRKRYEASDFGYNKANSFEFFDSATHATIAPAGKSEPGVSLQVFHGDNEALPFVDSSFDAYVSAASLYIVNDPVKMLQESYRVLRKGGEAGFSVLGKLKDSTFFSVMNGILEKHCKKHGVEQPKRRSFFYLGADESLLLKMFRDAGFSKVKAWHELAVFPLTPKEYLEEKSINTKETMEKFPPEARKAILDEIAAEVQQRFVDGVEVMTIDFIMVVCTK